MATNIFEDVIYNSIPRSTFPMPHTRNFSMQMGKNVPFLCMPVFPGDAINLGVEHLVRLAPQVAPVASECMVTVHYFLCRNTAVWEGWEEFISNPYDPSNEHPYLALTEPGNVITEGSIADYLGYPVGRCDGKINPLPLAHYNNIHNNYYRDQNLQTEKNDVLGDGLQDIATGFPAMLTAPCYNRAWSKDYFTSALPEPQKGDPVTIPIGETAPINWKSTPGNTKLWDTTGNPIPDGQALVTDGATTPGTTYVRTDGTNTLVNIDSTSKMEVDLSSATAISVETLRRAVRLQEWLEINSRSGNRYIETIKNHFNVGLETYRMDMPEYIGGNMSYINFSEVLQTGSTDETSPQGNMAGHGINLGAKGGIRRFVKEHGFVIGIVNVQPKPVYMNFTPKWVKQFSDPMDSLWPKFAQLGEQPVYNWEVDGDAQLWPSNTFTNVFGYQSRYAHLKYMPSSVHGEMKSSLAYWHMARKFETAPALNSDFVTANPTTRIFAVEDPDVDNLYVQLKNYVTVSRCLPRSNVPAW